jgi:hypothetical protein
MDGEGMAARLDCWLSVSTVNSANCVNYVNSVNHVGMTATPHTWSKGKKGTLGGDPRRPLVQQVVLKRVR